MRRLFSYSALQGVAAGLQFVVLAVLARALTPEALAYFLLASAIAQVLEPLTDLGGRFVAIRRLLTAPDSQGGFAVFWAGWLIKAAGLFSAGLCLLAWQAIDQRSTVNGTDVALLLLLCAGLPSSNPVTWIMRASGKQTTEGFLLVLQKVVLIAALLVFPPAADDGNRAVLFVACSMWAALVIGIALIRKSLVPGGKRATESVWTELKSCAAEGWPFSLSLIGGQLAQRLVLLVLATGASAGDVAVFGVAQSIILSALALPVVVQAVVLPRLARDYAVGGLLTERHARAFLVAMFGLGLAGAAVLVLGAPGVTTAITGESSESQAMAISALAIGIPFMVTSFAIRTLLAAAGGARAEPLITWVEAIATGTLTMTSYVLYGLVGVCLVTAVVYGIGCFARFWLIRGQLGGGKAGVGVALGGALTLAALHAVGSILPQSLSYMTLVIGLVVGGLIAAAALGMARRIDGGRMVASR